MMSNKFSSANIQQTVKTPNFFILCFCFFIVVLPFIFVWLFLGEFNVSKLNWVVPFNGNNVPIFNWLILAVLFALFVVNLLIYFLIYFFKKMNHDSLPFIIMFNVMCFSTILSGMIPYNSSNKNYIIIARFILVIVLTLISFFITNKIIIVVLLNSSNSYALYNEYKQEILEEQKEKRNFDKMINRKKEKDYIEIEKDEE